MYSNQKEPEINMKLNAIALLGNTTFSIILLTMFVLVTSEFFEYILTWFYGLFVIALMNFETLGSSLAFVHVTRNKQEEENSG